MTTRLWSPPTKMIESSNIQQYTTWLSSRLNLHFDNYHALWTWSVDHIDRFWGSLWDYFNIIHEGQFDAVKSGNSMPGVQWFEGTRLNYSEHVFKNAQDESPAILYADENNPIREITWKKLYQCTAAFQHFLLSSGIKKGDRIAACLSCKPEATVAFLGTNSMGAIWSSCSPDFGVQSIIDRFAQIEPKIFVADKTYSYGGKKIDITEKIETITKAIPSIRKVVFIADDPVSTSIPHVYWNEIMEATHHTLYFERVAFNDPIWILYSSGTTGLPKAITHSQGGVLLEHLKYLTFHQDIQSGERCFWYTTTGWMMWNYIQASLLCGGIIALYDGSPSYPNLNVLWQFAQDASLHHFGTSAGFILANKKAGIQPRSSFDISSLRTVSSTGSTLPPEGFQWIYENVKQDIWLSSVSGGTDVCSVFVGGNPVLPVYKGEIQCIALGCSLYAWDDYENAVFQTVGEMVITKPMPSMPIYLWNDVAYQRYKESYFKVYPGVWRHGDWIEITAHHGVVIYGRSDATLNRGGIRIGTSEIYRALEPIQEVKDSIIVCIEKANGKFYMPLFVMLENGYSLSERLKLNINRSIRKTCSPRHIPDNIFSTPDIPYTISGKKTEIPIKKIFMGKEIEKVVNQGVLRNPESMKFFIDFYLRYIKKK